MQLETLRCDEKDVMGRLYGRIPAADRAATLQTLEMVLAILDPVGGSADACCADQ